MAQDAIGGVINIVTRPEFNGFELGAQRSESSRGDGAITRADALIGGELWARASGCSAPTTPTRTQC
jgi:outer membrane receptor protein involved in Fe transport